MIGGGNLKRPNPTVEDARKLYLKEKVGGDTKKQLELARVFKLIGDALQGNRTLASVRREDAKGIRDHTASDRLPASGLRMIGHCAAIISKRRCVKVRRLVNEKVVRGG